MRQVEFKSFGRFTNATMNKAWVATIWNRKDRFGRGKFDVEFEYDPGFYISCKTFEEAVEFVKENFIQPFNTDLEQYR